MLVAPAARLQQKRRRQSPQVQPERPGPPCAMVLRLIRDLPGVPGVLATAACRSPPAGSIPASGDRDHTISPSASCRTPCDTPASIASRTQRPWRSRYAPLADEDRRTISMILFSDKQNYFCERGLTRFRKISPPGKSAEDLALKKRAKKRFIACQKRLDKKWRFGPRSTHTAAPSRFRRGKTANRRIRRSPENRPASKVRHIKMSENEALLGATQGHQRRC